jgi:hypothetical protein
MSSNRINSLAEEIVNSRDHDLAENLLKIKDLALYNDDPKRTKYEIYKFGLLEALSVAFKNEYGFIQNGWKLAVDLVHTFSLCIADSGISEKDYQNLVMQACENSLILARKLQEKYARSKLTSEEFLHLFRNLMREFTKIVSTHSFLPIKCIKTSFLKIFLFKPYTYIQKTVRSKT